jgi:hypothetical protein
LKRCLRDAEAAGALFIKLLAYAISCQAEIIICQYIHQAKAREKIAH